MLIDFLPRHEQDTDAEPQGGSSGKTRASDVLEQYGRDAIRLAEKLADVQSDNYRLRDERRTLKQQLTEAMGKVPADGMRVLSKDEAAAYDEYTKLGTAADIRAAIDTKTTAEQELSGLKREKALAKAADAAGFKSSVLTALAGDLDIQTKAGKDGKSYAVVVTDGTETALADYAAQAWGDFMPALVGRTLDAPDINATGRGAGGSGISDDERKRAAQRMRATF